MEKRLQKVAAEIGVNVRKTSVKAPFCIASQVFVISVEGSALVFGRCTEREDKWHVFIETRFPGPVVSVVSTIPASHKVIAGKTIATFDPSEISDKDLVRVLSDFKEISLLAAFSARFC